MNVSFVMPVFNSGAYLEAAVQSIFDNRCPGVQLELLLVDDCSTDPLTCDLLKSMEGMSGVRVVRHAANGGPAKARNSGMKAASSEWIAFLDADDLLSLGTMALRCALIAQHPEIRWLAGDMLEMRRIGELTHCHSFVVDSRHGAEIEPGIFKLAKPLTQLVQWPMLPQMGTMMLRRDLLQEIGGMDETLMYGEDNYFCLLASALADLYWITQPSVHLRRHHNSMTKDTLRLACESPRYTARLMRDARLRPIRKQLRWQHAAALRHMARVSLRFDLLWQARRAALQSLFWTPNSIVGLRLFLQTWSSKAGRT